jgi:hypothetical protein
MKDKERFCEEFMTPDQLTPLTTTLLERFIITQLVTKLGVFYKNRRLITAFTEACH